MKAHLCLAFSIVMLLYASLHSQQPLAHSVLQATGSGPAATLSSAQNMISAGHFHEAEQWLRNYLVANDSSSDAHEMLAYALLRENEPKDSLTEYTRAASLHTPSATLLKNVGLDYVLLGDYSDADRWTLRAVQTDPTDADAWYSLGRVRYTAQ